MVGNLGSFFSGLVGKYIVGPIFHCGEGCCFPMKYMRDTVSVARLAPQGCRVGHLARSHVGRVLVRIIFAGVVGHDLPWHEKAAECERLPGEFIS